MRDRIIQGYIEELQEKGMKFTMDDLAARIGISKRTLYEQFSSKAEILDEIIEQTFTELDEKTERIISNDKLSLIDKIKGVFTVLPTYFNIFDLRLLDQLKRSYPEQWRKVDAELKDDWKELRMLIEEGIRKDEIRDINVNLVMKLFIDSANSTLDQRFFAQNNISVSEALDAIVDVLLYGLVPENKR